MVEESEMWEEQAEREGKHTNTNTQLNTQTRVCVHTNTNTIVLGTSVEESENVGGALRQGGREVLIKRSGNRAGPIRPICTSAHICTQPSGPSAKGANGTHTYVHTQTQSAHMFAHNQTDKHKHKNTQSQSCWAHQAYLQKGTQGTHIKTLLNTE